MKARLLVVEDEEAVQKTWATTINRFNRTREEGDLEFEPTFVRSAAEADAMLDRRHIDCVITDLRLDHGHERSGGEDVIAEVRKIKAVPIAIMTGHPGDYDAVDGEFAPVKEFVKEAGNYREVLAWLNGLKQLIGVSNQAQRRFEEVFADLFHRVLWKNWKVGTLEQGSIDAKVRQLVTHVSEEMTDGAAASKLWPEEFYVRPALKTKLLTGDLLKVDEKVFAIVTPPCDLANTDQPESILLALCEEGQSDYQSEVFDRRETQRAKAMERIKNYLNQDKLPPSLHFLPQFGDMGPWFVSFKKLKCFSKAELTPQKMQTLMAARFASVSPLFVSNLTHRFSAYLGRPGQPDIDPAAAMAQLRAKEAAQNP